MTITNRDPNLKSEGNCQMRGRKPQLTPEIQALIAHHIKSGIGVKATAEATKISLPTLTRWLSRGRRESSGPYSQLVDLFSDRSIAIKRAVQKGFPSKIFTTTQADASQDR